jgi:hypothetical protein
MTHIIFRMYNKAYRFLVTLVLCYHLNNSMNFKHQKIKSET